MKFGTELLKSVLNVISVGAQMKIRDGYQNGHQTTKMDKFAQLSDLVAERWAAALKAWVQTPGGEHENFQNLGFHQ